MLGMMDDQSKERLFTAVNEYITQKNTQLSAINKAFPELSASEAEICRLILQGKKLSEICDNAINGTKISNSRNRKRTSLTRSACRHLRRAKYSRQAL